MLIHNKILLDEPKGEDSCLTDGTKNQILFQRRAYSPPIINPLEPYSINSGNAYVQPENSSGVWATQS
jgi:hypothetical protein